MILTKEGTWTSNLYTRDFEPKTILSLHNLILYKENEGLNQLIEVYFYLMILFTLQWFYLIDLINFFDLLIYWLT